MINKIGTLLIRLGTWIRGVRVDTPEDHCIERDFNGNPFDSSRGDVSDDVWKLKTLEELAAQQNITPTTKKMFDDLRRCAPDIDIDELQAYRDERRNRCTGFDKDKCPGKERK